VKAASLVLQRQLPSILYRIPHRREGTRPSRCLSLLRAFPGPLASHPPSIPTFGSGTVRLVCASGAWMKMRHTALGAWNASGMVSRKRQTSQPVVSFIRS